MGAVRVGYVMTSQTVAVRDRDLPKLYFFLFSRDAKGKMSNKH